MEACGSSHYWGREFQKLGHEVQLLPAQHVKAYLRGQKNDYNDALAIAEASQHGSIRQVAVKSLGQQDEQSMVHRVFPGKAALIFRKKYSESRYP